MKVRNNNLSAIKQNLIVGERTLREFRSDIPYINSNTKINMKINEHIDNPQYSDLITKMRAKSIVTGFKISNLRNAYEKSPNKIGFLYNKMKESKIGNCKECGAIIYNKLESIGATPQNVKLDFVDKKDGTKQLNHTFTVIGLDKDADITNPNTWGKNSVIVDGWSNFVKRTKDGIEHLKQIFKIDDNKTQCVFSEYSNK